MSGPRSQLRNSYDYDSLAKRIVALLLLLEAVSVWFLWTFDSIGSSGETSFALFLAADLVSFAMISYTFRALKRDGRFARWLLLAGCAFISVLLLFALT
jgi:hypothetical protein